jgi:hypothetical protein
MGSTAFSKLAQRGVGALPAGNRPRGPTWRSRAHERRQSWSDRVLLTIFSVEPLVERSRVEPSAWSNARRTEA